MFFEIGVPKTFAIFTGKHLYWRLFLIRLKACDFIKKNTPIQVFSCEYCEFIKNSFLNRAPPVVASEASLIKSSAQS